MTMQCQLRIVNCQEIVKSLTQLVTLPAAVCGSWYNKLTGQDLASSVSLLLNFSGSLGFGLAPFPDVVVAQDALRHELITL